MSEPRGGVETLIGQRLFCWKCIVISVYIMSVRTVSGKQKKKRVEIWDLFVPSICLYLLQEGSQVAGPPLVRLGQVDVFQVEHQVLTVFRSEDSTRVGAEQHTGLTELLQHVTGRRLGTAVNHRHLGGAQPRQGVAEQHAVKTKHTSREANE